jgi:hypothetical protein
MVLVFCLQALEFANALDATVMVGTRATGGWVATKTRR